MRDIAVAKREEAREMKEKAMKKAKNATANAQKAAAKRKEAIANAEKAVEHGKEATANAETAAKNARIALRKGNRAAEEATREAEECKKAVALMKSDMPNSRTLFIEAMEKVSQFHQSLSSDVDSSLEQVRGMDRMEEHFNLFRIYMDRIIRSCDSFERFQVIVRSRVDVLSFLDRTDALAISQYWISKQEGRGKLLPHESQNIREVTFPAQFPALTNHRQPWHKRVVKSAVRPFNHDFMEQPKCVNSAIVDQHLNVFTHSAKAISALICNHHNFQVIKGCKTCEGLSLLFLERSLNKVICINKWTFMV